MIKQILIFSIAASAYLKAHCQKQVQDVNGYLSNQVYKNIAAYNIRYSSFAFNRVCPSKYFYGNFEFFYKNFLADYGFKLEMKISKLSLIYPNEKFHLYEISTKGFHFLQDTGNFSIMHMGPISTDTYLLALNENNGDIKFISGQYFKSVISDDFNPDIKKPNSLISYLSMRAYVIKATDIVFVNKKHGKLIYSAYSQSYNRTATIKVSTNDIEDVAIIVK